MSVALAIEREDGRVVCGRCLIADDPLSRARGLMGRARLEGDEGLLLATSSIHTHFMRFPIDAVFVDEEMRIVHIAPNLRPWRLARKRGAHAVIELAAGTARRAGLGVGDRLALVPRNGNGTHGVRGIRVVLGSRDRRFLRVASFLLARDGFAVEPRVDPEETIDVVRHGAADVVLLDASDSLAAAARLRRAIEATSPTAGVVLVADETRDGAVRKWGSFDAVVDAVERSYAETRIDGFA